MGITTQNRRRSATSLPWDVVFQSPDNHSSPRDRRHVAGIYRGILTTGADEDYDNSIYQWEGDDTQKLTPYTWRSKKFLLPSNKTMLVGRVVFSNASLTDYWDDIEARLLVQKTNTQILSERKLWANFGIDNGGYGWGAYPISGDALETIPTVDAYAGGSSLVFKLYHEDDLQHTASLYTDKPFKVTLGKRNKEISFQLEGNVDIKKLDLATSIVELINESNEGE